LKKASIKIVTGVFAVIIFLFSGCQTSYNVKTDASEQLKSDITAMSSLINSIDITLSGPPDLDIYVHVDGYPSDQAPGALLDRVKTFTTVKNLDEIAIKYGWGGHIQRVNFSISYKDSSIDYSTGYFERYDASDGSTSFTGAYEIWR